MSDTNPAPQPQRQNDPPANPAPPVAPNPQPQPSAPAQPQNPSDGLQSLLTGIADAVRGIPEQTANAVREAIPNTVQPPTPNPSGQHQATTQGDAGNHAQQRQGSRVSRWFFGIKD